LLALLLLAAGRLRGAYLRYGATPLFASAVAALTALVVHGMFDAGLYVSRLAPVLFLPIGFALAGAGGEAEVEAEAKTLILTLTSTLALILTLALALTSTSRAAFRSNLAAVSQTRAELSVYTWPKIPYQDALRRSPAVDLTPAIAYYRAALAAAPALASANRRLGQIELSRGDYAAAREHLLAAHRSAPEQQASRFLLGESYAIAGQVAEAADLWRTLGAHAWSDAHGIGRQIFTLRQWWYESIGEPEKSRRIGAVLEQLSQDARSSVVSSWWSVISGQSPTDN
jgi:tetratricopeptide (TPR) repeat protein